MSRGNDFAIDFRVDQSRGDYRALRGWVMREVGLALTAVGLVSVSCLTLYGSDLLGRAQPLLERMPPEAWKTVLAVGGVLAWRTLIWRPVVGAIARASIYPVHGYQVIWPRQELGALREEWDSEQMPHLSIRSLDGTLVHAQMLEGDEGAPHSGHTILFCAGNAMVYEDLDPGRLGALTRQGYNVLVYHPPQYGLTAGSRTLSSDYLAAEACIQYLLRAQAEETIHIVGWSIGSGAAVELMTRYRLGHSLLVAPLARIESIVRRSVGRWAAWFVTGAIRDRLEYNNLDKIAQLQTEQLTIIQAGADALMGQAGELSEAEMLRDRFTANGRAGQRLTFETASELGHSDLDVHSTLERIFVTQVGK
jgi:pimeloyl-ACP methyl ester carboxylesterase